MIEVDVTREWPDWWKWDLELTSHLLKRMVDRSFSEVDLRAMMEVASAYRPSELGGRYVIETSHDAARWEVVVEPDEPAQVLVVITAYEVAETQP